MVNFTYDNDVVLTLTSFEIDNPSDPFWISFVAIVQTSEFMINKTVQVPINTMKDFRRRLFYYNQKQYSKVSFYDLDFLLSIEIERQEAGDEINIVIKNGLHPNCDMSFNIKYITRNSHLDSIYEELFMEMDLLGINTNENDNSSNSVIITPYMPSTGRD